MAAMTETYKTWSSEEMADWIISIDTSFESKYRELLRSSLKEHGVTGQNIDELDREDLKTYGIINLEDRKRVYAEIQKLIVNKKRRDSLLAQQINHDLDNINNHSQSPPADLMDIDKDDIKTEENVLSLSDDDGEEEDKLTLLNATQRYDLATKGYCMLDPPLKEQLVVDTVQGYIRQNFYQSSVERGLIRLIINYYHNRYNPEIYVEIICKPSEDGDDNKENNEKGDNLENEDENKENDDNQDKSDENQDQDEDEQTFLVPKVNITLSVLLQTRMEDFGNRITVDKVRKEIMHYVLRYLGHHRGKKPEAIAKPIRSVKMERICADKWDADYVNSMTKKTIFQVILAANYLNCPSLLHLGCAKIATLIKGKSPEEIKNILADDA